MQASLTGHLVLSTVHTNDAVGAITRMRDMKVEPFLLASTLRAVIAQRLVRRLCPTCRKPVKAPQSVAAMLGIAPGTLVYEPVGCEACGHSGYKGRIGVFEAIRIDETIPPPDQRGRRRGGDRAACVPGQPEPGGCGACAGGRGVDDARGSGARVAARCYRSGGRGRGCLALHHTAPARGGGPCIAWWRGSQAGPASVAAPPPLVSRAVPPPVPGRYCGQ